MSANNNLARELADALGYVPAAPDVTDCDWCAEPAFGLFADIVNDEAGCECNEVVCGRCLLAKLLARARQEVGV